MNLSQVAILAPVPPMGSYLFFSLVQVETLRNRLARLAGLVFVAFGKSFDAFEAQMRRMAGQDDEAFFWCPPMLDGRLDLRRLGL